jgi:DNA end-binding protein Ku
MLEPRERGIVLWTLRYGDEVREMPSSVAETKGSKPDPKALALVRRLIDQRTKPWDPSMLTDPVQDRLLDIIAAKKKGRRAAKPKMAAEPQPSNVINIMDALRKSVASEKNRSKA